MPSRSSPRTRPAEPPAPTDSKRITVVPPSAADGGRPEMPTLVDDVELEAARVQSMRRSSLPPSPASPPPASRTISGARHSEGEIEIVWSPESEQLDPEELFSKYVRLLGAFTRVPFITVPFERIPSLSLDSRMGFLVALIDGTSTIQTLLDIAGMPPREVLHAIATLRDLGIVALRDE